MPPGRIASATDSMPSTSDRSDFLFTSASEYHIMSHCSRNILFRGLDVLKLIPPALSWAWEKFVALLRSIVSSIIDLFRKLGPGKVMMISGLDEALEGLDALCPKLLSATPTILTVLEVVDYVFTFVNVVNSFGAAVIAANILFKIRAIREQLQNLLSAFDFHLNLAHYTDLPSAWDNFKEFIRPNFSWSALKEILVTLSTDITRKMTHFTEELSKLVCNLDSWRVHGGHVIANLSNLQI
jgi:hypothetical protein